MSITSSSTSFLDLDFPLNTISSMRAWAKYALTGLMLWICAIGIAHAQTRFEEDFDDQDKPWQEIAIQLPPAPATENLLQFYVGAVATQSFFIDAASLKIGEDGVIRYTLVARSTSGAESISYEGIRCQSTEKKLYAFGHKDGTWSRSRRDQWESIHSNLANRQHAALVLDYFCESKTIAGKAEDILRRMRTNWTLSPQFKRF